MYDCSYCGVSMTRWSNYLDHVGTAHEGGDGMKKFKCRNCQKVFLKQNNFQAHCKNKKPRQCSKCPVMCCTKKQLEIHRRRVHPSFQCLQCENFFPRKASLKKHESIKRWNKTSCMQCSHSFCTTKALRLHVESTHEESRNPNQDNEADSSKDDPAKDDPAKDDPAKDDSSKVHSVNNLVQKGCRTCPVCNKIFFNHFNVRRHLKTEHWKTERWECDQCEKSFATEYSLKYHVKACHKKDTLFNCGVCVETFDTMVDLVKHNKSSHNREVKFECRYCGINFNTKSNMNRHKQEIHCKETRLDTAKMEVLLYNFACDQCSFVSKRKSHLMRHVKSKHDKDDDNKKFCPICYKMFCNSSKVKRHIITIHETEASSDAKDETKSLKPLSNESHEKVKKKCHYCEKTILGNNMWRHIEEAHHKTKYNTSLVEVSSFPHKCEQCAFKTKRKFDLKRHYMQKHSLCDVNFPCEFCGKVFKYEASHKRHIKTCQEKSQNV